MRKTVWFGILTCVGVSLVQAQDRVIRRSDVVFMYDNAAMYEPYGCTVLGWAGHAQAEHIRTARSKGIRHFSSSIGFLTEFKRVIDFDDNFLDAACRNFEGEPFIVPWLWDHHHQHNGHGAYWWCTQSPLYRKYLESRLVEVMRTGVDGLHIDDYRGTSGAVTWKSACFCRHCLAGFRGYLASRVSKEKRTALGLTSLKDFNYRQFLLDRGVTPELYRTKRWEQPLAEEFLDYHVRANLEYVQAFRRKAEEIKGGPISLSVNSGLNSAHALMIAPELDYFCCEVGHEASGMKAASHPITIYKLGDALDRPIASTASGQDWAFTAEHNLPGLIRSWTALSYAFGHTLMAPHRQWCYTKEKGTHWKTWPPEDFADLYQFIRKHSRYFDGYNAVARVAVVYDNAARRRYRADIEPICTTLAERNIPFTIVLAGDDWLPRRLSEEQLQPFSAVIVHKDHNMDPDQQAVLEAVKRDARLITWPDEAALATQVPAFVQVEDSAPVMVVPRVHPDPEAPLVLHVLNRSYDADTDRWPPLHKLRIRLHPELMSGRTLTAAHWVSPDGPTTECTLGDHHLVTVPTCGMWGLLVLESTPRGEAP